MNVLTGERYSVITNEFRNMVLGKYGRLPGPPDESVLQRCAPDGKLFTRRPADYIDEVDLVKAAEECGGLIKSNRDMLLYLLFPGPAKAFMEQREATAAA